MFVEPFVCDGSRTGPSLRRVYTLTSENWISYLCAKHPAKTALRYLNEDKRHTSGKVRLRALYFVTSSHCFRSEVSGELIECVFGQLSPRTMPLSSRL